MNTGPHEAPTPPETAAALTLIANSPEETDALAVHVARVLTAPRVLALHGELGSGKTFFVQALAAALGIRRPVTSPTFTLVNEYRGICPLIHIDLYRIEDPAGMEALGLDEYLEGDGYVAIEWAERAAHLLPHNTVHVAFERGAAPQQRTLRLSGLTRGQLDGLRALKSRTC